MSRVVVAGSLNMDLIIRVDRLPGAGETVAASSRESRHGGKGANQAYYAARASVAPVTVAMVGCVGADADGRELRAELAANGIDVEHVVEVDGATGLAVILVDGSGENQIAVVGGANNLWPRELLNALEFRATDVVALQGEIPFEALACIATKAHLVGARLVVNAAPFDARILDLVEFDDIVVLNEHEACLALGLTMPVTADDLIGSGIDGSVVVTIGPGGALVSAFPHESVNRVHAHVIEVADTVGAGDAFVGALATAVSRSVDLVEATRWGCASAALGASAPGARSALATSDNIAVLLGGGSC